MKSIAASFTAVVAIAVSSAAIPSASAAPDPCAASEVAKTIGSVATSTGNYLDSHPQTNQALTTIAKQQPGPQSIAAAKAHFDANPQAAKDMQQLQQPLATLSSRCKLPLTLPQLLGLIQAAQQSTGVPASLPGAAAGGPATGPVVGPTPAQTSAVSPVSQGTAPLPTTAIAGLP